ncbi:hypothetical protein HELRODRAFT_156082 [Helobdella robusta]|uniref:SH3 domain-containing protein n=1 Tax=Helobdella robusta TaxID=6412 RepID=T1ELR6_HELRO|nr:hypothetical protein HELRODRAFT_156082 [Helobdella robusta]ESN92589.1 hypothetical protein HELRODRAFT_156082 [Helobdella robusta]
MSTSDDIPTANSDSFWEVDCYKRTVKRAEDGFTACNDLIKMIQERAEIEKEYAKRLKMWSKRWNEYFDKCSEYGSTKLTLKESLEESDKLASVHLTIRERLNNEISINIKDWRNENYKKQMMVGGCKEAKSFEEDFKRAQKPWSKKLSKVIKCKKDYHNACKLERTAINQETNAKNNTEISLDQLRKLQEKVDRCKKDVIIMKEKYEQALIEINAYNGRYIEDMAEVFQKTQDFEKVRLNFIKGILFKLQSCLDLTKFTEIPIIYNNYTQSVNKLEPEKDLKWWSENHGVEMAMTWPTFEEYITEFHSITSKPTKSADGGVMLTYVQKNDSDPVSSTTSSMTSSSISAMNKNIWQANEKTSASADFSNTNVVKNGVKVKALYDYVSGEKDEISFKAGEVFLKLKNRDEQGWCTGLKDGKVGLYPDHYVEPVIDTLF